MKLETPNSVLALAQADLACYSIAQWPPFELAAHHRIIIDKLEAVERGEICRLMIFMPPRHGKSLITTQMFPAWYLGRHPDRFVISASYGQDLADDFGRKVRNLISGPMQRTLFPACRLADDSASMRRFNTQAGGSYYAVGRGGPITGRGAHLLLLDDPLKDREEAQSETIRRGLHEWYSHVAYTRLQPGAAVVLIETRWHEDDLAGWLLSEHADENWVVVSLPAIAEVDESFRRAGEPLWPERFPSPDLQRIRQSIGSAAWASLYQQRPAAAEGAIFKREWWRFYTQLPDLKRVIVSLDPACKTGRENDYSAMQVWGEGQAGFYLLANWKQRVAFPDLKRALVLFCEQWKPDRVLVEDASAGISLIQELQSSTSLPIKPIKVDRDKQARAESCTGMLEAGRIFLPADAPWLEDFLEELSNFPNAPHDDQTDALTMALNFLRGDGAVLGVLELMKKWGGFIGMFSSPQSPRSDPLQKEEILKVEAKIRGLSSTRPEAWLKAGAFPCPRCRSELTVAIAAQRHCNCCGLDWFPDGAPEVYRGPSRKDYAG